ncbi:haloacid dehalogenase type II [Paractinoplanes atraurantiacus]|uniref:2-haloacid dehalogenase n=1 Tax=Paractinoplanes atraurantiacus TaxID=1036182 RepID=A0A285GPH6_9ACTN|nr:haloacid dehalogenase type II [Actinoplanes atraurantiacus]SNY25469.1 2-haloacid dehalogenase [Actinoplanes atraurantiacus]
MTVIAFDVNETLLDLRALDPLFADTFDDPGSRGQWFAQMLQVAFVGGLTGQYVDFTTAQHAALSMLADRLGKPLPPERATAIVEAMSALPPHAEVPAALARLREAGFTMVALTNSVQSVAEAQLRYAGLGELFNAAISADSVRRLKPAPEPYHAVAQRFGVEPSEVRLVAAHAWDVSGALAAGCRAALVRRPGVVAIPLGAQPDIVGPTLTEVADRIIAAR